MIIPTEPIGSIPRPLELIEAVSTGDSEDPRLLAMKINPSGERFSPFCDDTSTTGDTAFAKIRARVEGTALAAEIIGGR